MSLLSFVRRVLHRCDRCGAAAISVRCDEGLEGWLCPEHAADEGYCAMCGEFSAGQDGFDWHHPGLCDNCNDEFEADTDWGGHVDNLIEVCNVYRGRYLQSKKKVSKMYM